MTDGTEAMMKFRTAYLQAIARCWSDPSDKYLKKFTKNPDGCLRELGFESPWSVDIEMDRTKRGEWRPQTSGGWIGPDAVISIWLPPAPAPVEQQGEAWARYYDEFPTFLGTKDYQPPPEPGSVGQSYPLGMGQWQDFLEFGGVTMRLIAMAWSDKELQRALQKSSTTVKEKGKERTVVADGVRFFHKWVGYNVPWNMSIELNLSRPDDEGPYRWDGIERDWPRPRPQACRNALRLYVPDRPSKSDRSIDAVALSAYNVTGDQYPFTCP